MNKTHLLFLIILAEGYVVLACELLAIRQLIPFVGSGTETISIIISAVLLPLAIGYHCGGNAFHRHYARAKQKKRTPLSVRKILLKNITSSLIVLAFGLSYMFLEVFFTVLDALNIHHRLLKTAIYASLFLVMPVFLLGQTVPLVSNYFSRAKLSEITGKMLFFSTAGSFLGSVFSTIVLMTFIGVHHTVVFTLGLLCILCWLLVRKWWAYEVFLTFILMGLLYITNGTETMKSLNIISDNAYNTVILQEDKEEESLLLIANRSPSSKISKHFEDEFPYWQYMQTQFIAPISKEGTEPREMLIIGAGGFTIGINDTINHYTYIDIDKDLKEISEKHFLKKPLSPNKQFVATSARAFVHNTTQRFDFILIDAYTNVHSIPMECTTREFLLDVKKLLNPGGIVVANVISDPSYSDKFSYRYANTFASVFPQYTRQIIGDFLPWPDARKDTKPTTPNNRNNVLYIYFHHKGSDDRTIYTDDKNTYSLDRN